MSALNYNRLPGFGDLAGDRLNPNAPDYDSRRDERIDQRAAEIADERGRDPERVKDAMTDAVCSIFYGDFVESVISDFLIAYNAAPDEPHAIAECARELFDRIWPTVAANIRRDAETDAEAEIQAFEERGP